MWASLGLHCSTCHSLGDSGIKISTVTHAPTSECVLGAYVLHPELSLRNAPSRPVPLPDYITCLLNSGIISWLSGMLHGSHLQASLSTSGRFRNCYMPFSLWLSVRKTLEKAKEGGKTDLLSDGWRGEWRTRRQRNEGCADSNKCGDLFTPLIIHSRNKCGVLFTPLIITPEMHREGLVNFCINAASEML